MSSYCNWPAELGIVKKPSPLLDSYGASESIPIRRTSCQSNVPDKAGTVMSGVFA